MHKIFRYIMLFVILALIQACFLSRLSLATWFMPLIYACFMIVLPMQLSRIQTLFIGATVGLLIDVFTGTAGLNTAATTAIAYIRPALLYAIFGLEEIKEGGAPSNKRFSHNKFYFYSFYMLAIHSLIYFMLETLSVSMIDISMLRAGVSTLVGMFAIYVTDTTFNARGTN